LRCREAHARGREERGALSVGRTREGEGGESESRAGQDRFRAGRTETGDRPRFSTWQKTGVCPRFHDGPAREGQAVSMKNLIGFQGVTSRLRQKPDTVREIYVDAERNDARVRDLREAAKRANVRVIPVDSGRLDGMAGGVRHQGVVAMADPVDIPKFI